MLVCVFRPGYVQTYDSKAATPTQSTARTPSTRGAAPILRVRGSSGRLRSNLHPVPCSLLPPPRIPWIPSSCHPLQYQSPHLFPGQSPESVVVRVSPCAGRRGPHSDRSLQVIRGGSPTWRIRALAVSCLGMPLSAWCLRTRIEVIPAPIPPESQSVSSHSQRLQSPLSWVRWRSAAALWILAVAIVRMCVWVRRACVSARGIDVTARAVFVVLTPLDVGWAGDAVVDFSRCRNGLAMGCKVWPCVGPIGTKMAPTFAAVLAS